MRVLFVAPAQDGIDALNEIAVVTKENDVTALTGIVTRRDLERELQSEQYDIVHFAQHGTSGLLRLSDGLVTAEWLARRMEGQRNLKLVFINSCDSIEVGAAIHNAIGCPVISYPDPVVDRVASRFAEEVYGSLRSGAGISEAFHDAMASISRLFPDSGAEPILINGIQYARQDDFLILCQRVREVEGEVRTLRRLVDWRGVTPREVVILLAIFVAQVANIVIAIIK